LALSYDSFFFGVLCVPCCACMCMYLGSTIIQRLLLMALAGKGGVGVVGVAVVEK